MDDNWEPMFARLAAFKKKHGHCRIKTSDTRHPRLGRWIAVQRYKGRLGELSADRLRRLNRIGFVWCPGDHAWKRMFQKLAAFKKARGHCDVPEGWPRDRRLANWVQRQRIARRKDGLSPERVGLLEELGFRWAIYGTESAVRTQAGRKGSPVKPPARAGERLYCIRQGAYVQYNGTGRKPRELTEYMAAREGTTPPYIPLPRGRVIFYLGDRYATPRKLIWNGSGPLPQLVLRYVKRNGVLPPHD